MEPILAVIGLDRLLWIKSDRNDDIVDRISHRQTTTILVIFAVLVTTKQFVGDAINCWVPAHFKENQEEYANSYCWIRNTYYLPNDRPVPKASEDREMITYYQWLPMILLLQALFFYLPHVVWSTFNTRSGIDINSIIASGLTFNATEMAEVRQKTLDLMTKQLDRYLTSDDEKKDREFTISLKNCFSRVFCFVCGRRSSNGKSYLVLLYIFVKLLYVANVLGQLFLLDRFLGTNFHFYGIDVLKAVASGTDWTESSRFPRVTMCDFNVRRLGNVHRYAVQCVLPINQFNEKIYLFLWFWMVAVAALTCFSFLKWTIRMIFKRNRKSYVRQHLEYVHHEDLRDQDKKHLKMFVRNYLKYDGVFVLYLVAQNTDSITATEYINRLWEIYRSKKSAPETTTTQEGVDKKGNKRTLCCC